MKIPKVTLSALASATLMLSAAGGAALGLRAADGPRHVVAAADADHADHGGRAGHAADDPDGHDPDAADPDGGADGDTPDGGDDWLTRQRTYPFTGLDLGTFEATARGQANALVARRNAATATAAATPAWQSLGPNLGGRITDLVIDPAHANTVYAAAASGGVWKSTNGGASFTYSWNTGLVQAVGALAVTSTGTLYAGTGEANPGGGSSSFPGNGVYKSTDGGVTWQAVGLTGTDRIGRIAIDPTNDNRVFAAATGNLFVPGGPRGLYESTDAGATWTQVLAGGTTTTGAVDVAITPGNPSTVYASMWDAVRTPGGRNYGGTGSGLYRSTDGGGTWTRLAGGLPASSSNLGRIGVAVAKSDANRVYAIAADATGNFLGFWTSTDAGTTWTQITNTSTLSGSQSTYGWWFGRIWVDPAAAKHIWVAGVSMLESTDAGGTWSSGSSFHSDQHALAVDPSVAGRVLIGNDGGVYTSTAGGSVTGSWSHASGLGNMQFYSLGVSQQDPTRINGGLQDNGSVRSWASWGSYVGGDGLMNLIDPTNQNKIYGCSQNGSCVRSTNAGSSTSGFGSTTASRRAWLTPIAFDPGNPAIMYYGGERLNRSTDSAASWTAISGDLSNGGGGSIGYYDTISTIAVAKTDGKVVYAGTDDGRVWITRDTGGTWTDVSAGVPNRWITRIAVDPTDANTAYVTVSGYRNGDNAPHVLRTANGGGSWQDVSGNLPNSPVNVVTLDPQNHSVLYVGTDVGVYTSTDGGTTWTPVGTGLPLISVADLQTAVSAGQTVLTAGTFGLGIYQLTVPATAANDFSLTVAPTGGSVAAGASATATVSTTTTSGTAQTVALTATGLPAGVTATFAPASVTSGGTSTLTVATTAATVAGTYPVTITGTGTGATHSATYTLTVTGTGTGGIANGGFDSGSLAGWTTSGVTAITTSGPHSGTGAALVGSTSPSTTSSLAQTFTVPAGNSTLTFWYDVTCPDTVTYDWATATLKDNTTGTTTTPLAKTCVNPASGWKQVSVTVTAGHSYTLTLTNKDDDYAGDPTYTKFDDVALN